MCNKMTPVLLACSALMAQPGHGPSGSGSSLQITVNSVQQYASPGLPTLILPDSAGPYTNGSDGVCATMGSNATVLTLELDCSSEQNPRYLVFQSSNYPGTPLAAPTGDSSYGCPASSPLTNPPSPAFPYTNKILVGVGTAFQSMQAGIVYSAQITFATQSTTTTGTSAYRLDYDTGADFPSDGANSSPAWVYAVGFTNGSATKWVIESAPVSQLGPPNTAMLVQEIKAKHFDQATECGFYQVPFSFTLAAQ
jgi:hypothetical protein